MKKWIVFLLLIILSQSSNAQHKIVLKRGLHRTVIKPGKLLGVTTQGEAYHYTNWRSVCSGCYREGCMDSLYNRRLYLDSAYYYDKDCADTICYNNQWMLDSVKSDCIMLKRFIDNDSAYRFDTIPYKELRRYQHALKKQPYWFWAGEIQWADSVPEHYSWIYAIPVRFETKKVMLDSISSFTLSKAEKCATFDMGTVLLAAAAIIASPIVAAEGPGYNWKILAGGEAIAGYLVLGMYRNVQSLRVKKYNTAEWKVKVR